MPEKSESLGKIKYLEVREIFKDEARDFTPWLTREENLSLLSEAIGLPIKFVEAEASVGSFSVDILAEEEGTGRKIIIENQFGTSDHDHLGKVITYASGHDAKVIVWIFENIREEHRQAIEWLNDNTNDELDFFAINLQIWRIDDSSPAAKFEVVVSPNEWTKTIRGRSPREVSETKLQQLDFWTRFRAYAAKNFKGLKLQKPQPQHWYSMAIGTSEAHIALAVNTTKDSMSCEIYINNNKELFNALKKQKDEIESKLKVELEWREAAKACRIKANLENASIRDLTKSDTHFDWLGNMALKFQKQFAERIRELNQD